MRTTLLCTMVLAWALVSGGEMSAATVTVGSITGACDSTVNVPVTIDNAAGMLSLEFTLAYDTSKITAGTAQTGSVTSGFAIASYAAGGVMRVALASGTAATGAGSVAQIPFTVSAGAPNATVLPLTISNVLINDVAATGKNGALTTSCGSACATPVAPMLSGPARATSGVKYTLTITAVTSANEYVVEESTSSTFTSPAARTISGALLAADFTHAVSAPTTYYYRARARNTASGCNKESGNSSPAAVTVSPPGVQPTKYVAVVASTPGSGGAMFKTAAQFYNGGSDTASGKLIFHPSGKSGSASDPSTSYAVAPGQALSFEDLLVAVGGTGVGTLDIVPSSGPVPTFVARIFNDWGTKGTAGMTIDAMSESEALHSGETGVLIAPIDPVRMRFNIGIRTVGASGASMTIKVYDRFGALKKTLTSTFAPAYFQQTSAKQLTGLDPQRDDTISFLINSGSVLIYGASTDNVTQDPGLQMARRLE